MSHNLERIKQMYVTISKQVQIVWVSTTLNIFYYIKLKVKLFVCFTKHYDMKMYWGVKVQIYEFITSALDGGE
jgi:hypothetical protein